MPAPMSTPRTRVHDSSSTPTTTPTTSSSPRRPRSARAPPPRTPSSLSTLSAPNAASASSHADDNYPSTSRAYASPTTAFNERESDSKCVLQHETTRRDSRTCDSCARVVVANGGRRTADGGADAVNVRAGAETCGACDRRERGALCVGRTDGRWRLGVEALTPLMYNTMDVRYGRDANFARDVLMRSTASRRVSRSPT